jgi:hypothetical protein
MFESCTCHPSCITQSPYPPTNKKGYPKAILQGIRKEFVHLRNASRDTEIDCSIANLNDQSSKNVGVDLEICKWLHNKAGSLKENTLLVTLSFFP